MDRVSPIATFRIPAALGPLAAIEDFAAGCALIQIARATG
jgi:hypothetical protein